MATICTGCSLICEDIELALRAGSVTDLKNVCRKGSGHFHSLSTERTKPTIDGQEVSLDQAIAEAAKILKEAKSPLLYGWTNSTLEAQKAGIDLAKKLGAKIDDPSSFCQGRLMEMVLKGALPTCTLDDVRNFADVVIFWGSDPSNSHPRHLSRFSYYPRGEKRDKGYEEERNSISIDVRKSSTARLCKYYFQVPPGGDEEFISAVNDVLDGKVPKYGDKKKMIELGTILRKAEYGVIFPGQGLEHSLGDRMDLLCDLVVKLNGVSTYKVAPMAGHYNSRGFNQLMLNETGYINQVSFKDGKISHGTEQGIAAASKSCDAAMVVGADPLSSLPFGVARNLAEMPLIALDPRRSLTTDAARVVIPSAIYGLEAGGSAIRMDGVKVSFEPLMSTDLPTDEAVISRIKEAI